MKKCNECAVNKEESSFPKANGCINGISARCKSCINRYQRLHGRKKPSSIYKAWEAMKYRCRNKKCKSYKDYGGRGINYDPFWELFENFRKDMGSRPEGTSLDRINNNEGYYKENCRWATNKQQNRNTRINIWITIDGVSRTLPEWCEVYKVSYNLVKDRYKRQSWPILLALTKEKQRRSET